MNEKEFIEQIVQIKTEIHNFKEKGSELDTKDINSLSFLLNTILVLYENNKRNDWFAKSTQEGIVTYTLTIQKMIDDIYGILNGIKKEFCVS